MPASSPITSDAAPAQQPTGEGDDRLVEHAPSGRLVAQRGLFRGPDPVCPDDLYAQVSYGSAVRERQRLVVHAGSEVSMDTYFGRFPASYWQRWTVVGSVDVEVTASGSGRISVVASDVEGETRTVAAQDVDRPARRARHADGAARQVRRRRLPVGRVRHRRGRPGGRAAALDGRAAAAAAPDRRRDLHVQPGRRLHEDAAVAGRRPRGAGRARRDLRRGPGQRHRRVAAGVPATSRRRSTGGCATSASPTSAAPAGSAAACTR